MVELSRFEKDQLYSIGGLIYGEGRAYWWGKKTMPKLAAKGLVERHPDEPQAWRITDAGRRVYAELYPDRATVRAEE